MIDREQWNTNSHDAFVPLFAVSCGILSKNGGGKERRRCGEISPLLRCARLRSGSRTAHVRDKIKAKLASAS